MKKSISVLSNDQKLHKINKQAGSKIKGGIVIIETVS